MNYWHTHRYDTQGTYTPKYRVFGNKEGTKRYVFGKGPLDEICLTPPLLAMPLVLMWGNQAIKISPGGVLSDVTYGKSSALTVGRIRHLCANLGHTYTLDRAVSPLTQNWLLPQFPSLVIATFEQSLFCRCYQDESRCWVRKLLPLPAIIQR